MARKKFTTTIEEEALKELKKIAIDHDVDAGKMIELLVKDYLRRKEESPKE
jgi:hypothetical protein